MFENGIITRLATMEDIGELRAMQERSLRELGAAYYSPQALEGFLGSVSTMDDAVVAEGHYFVTVTGGGRIVASGGWSKLVPTYDAGAGPAAGHAAPATVRSVFVDPELPRRGLGSGIMAVVETDAAACGIRELGLTATLSGVPLYVALGYRRLADTHVDLGRVRFACVKMAKRLATDGEWAGQAGPQGRRRGGRSFE